MITARWIPTLIAALAAAALTQPCLAGSGGSGTDRSDSPTTSASERTAAPQRSAESAAPAGESSSIRFTSTSAGNESRAQFTNPQTRTYTPRVNRLEPHRDPRERFPQPESIHDRPFVLLDRSEERPAALDADNPRQSGELESLLERNEVLVDQPSSPKKEDGNRIVYCNRKLLEMHIRRSCEMLGDVTPTPVPLKSAREARYAPCTVCYKPR